MAAAEVCSSLPQENKMDLNEGSYDTEDEKMDTEGCEEIDKKEIALSKKEEGNKYYTGKDYNNAVSLYTEAITLDPTCAAYYGNRAAAYMMLADYQKGLDDARTAFTLDSSFVKAYHRAAKCYIATGQTNNALQTLEKAKGLEPKNKLVLAENLTALCVCQSDSSPVIDLPASGKSKKPSIMKELKNVKMMADYEKQSANAYETGDYRKIEFCMRRLLEFAPSALTYKSLQAECLALTGKFNDAQLLTNEILQKDSRNKDALYVRGLCLYYQDQTERAYNVFQHLLRTAPDFNKARVAYKKAKNLETKKEAGNNAFRNHKYKEALELYTEALTIDPVNKTTNSKLYFNRATVNFKLGSKEPCIKDCTSAIDLDPSYLKAYLRRAKCYMDTEKYEEAVRDYEKITKMDHNHEYRRLLKDAKLELKKSKRKDYYKILGVSKTAGECEIKKAYRKEALKHHPDRHSSADDTVKKEEEIKFKEVGEAYSVLSDKQKRHRYDNGLDIEEGGGMDFGDFDPNIIFQSFFGGGGRGGGGYNSFGGHGCRGGGGGGFPGGFSFQFG